MNANSNQAAQKSAWYVVLLVLLVLCFFSDMFLSYFPVGPFPVRNYFWVLSAGMIFVGWICLNRNSLRFGLVEKIVSIITLCGLIGGISEGVFSGAFASSLFKMLIIPYGLFLITTVALRRNEKYLHIFVLLIVVSTAFSALVAVLQWLDIDVAWQLRQAMPVSEEDEGGILQTALERKHRPMGMAYFPISLGYQVCWAFPLAWYVTQRASGYVSSVRIFSMFCAVAILLGGLASGTRTAFIGLIFELFFLMWAKDYIRFRLRTALMVVFVGVFVVAGVGYFQSDRWLLSDTSARAKLWLAYMGVLFIYEHPFGQGTSWAVFNEFKMQAIGGLSGIDSDLIFEVETFTPHNQFINSGVMYGWFGLILIISFYFLVFFRLLKIAKQSKRLGDFMPHALLAGFIGYIVNSMSHNAGLFVGDHFGWYFLGLWYLSLARQKAIFSIFSKNSSGLPVMRVRGKAKLPFDVKL